MKQPRKCFEVPGRRGISLPSSTRALLFAAVLSLGLSACGTISNWFDTSKTKPTELVDIKTTLTVAQLWQTRIGSAEKFFFAPAIVGNTIAYAAAADGTVAKIDLSSGKTVWQKKAGQDLSAGVGSDGKLVAVVSVDGELIVFDSEGRQLWTAPTAGEIVSPPAVGGGVVVVRTTDSHFIAFDAETGKRRWGFQRQPQTLVLRIAYGMTIGNDLLYSGLPGGRLIALSLNTGVLRWDSSVSTPKGATDLERVADVVGTPVFNKGSVCVVAYQGRIACFDATAGSVVWTRDVSSATGIAIDERFAFVTDEKSVVQGMSASTGVAVWRNDKLLYRRVSAGASVGLAVVVCDYQGTLHWLSREDGSFMARTKADGSPLTAQPIAFSHGSTPAVLVQTRDGNLFAFGTS